MIKNCCLKLTKSRAARIQDPRTSAPQENFWAMYHRYQELHQDLVTKVEKLTEGFSNQVWVVLAARRKNKKTQSRESQEPFYAQPRNSRTQNPAQNVPRTHKDSVTNSFNIREKNPIIKFDCLRESWFLPIGKRNFADSTNCQNPCTPRPTRGVRSRWDGELTGIVSGSSGGSSPGGMAWITQRGGVAG